MDLGPVCNAQYGAIESEGVDNPKTPQLYKRNPYKRDRRNQKKARSRGASYPERSEERTNKQTFFFQPYPKTKPLVPRGNRIFY